jgi:hypothetical protein
MHVRKARGGVSPILVLIVGLVVALGVTAAILLAMR